MKSHIKRPAYSQCHKLISFYLILTETMDNSLTHTNKMGINDSLPLSPSIISQGRNPTHGTTSFLIVIILPKS